MDVAIAKIDNAKFRRPVVPGDQLHIRVEVLKEKSKMLLLSCRAEVDGELAASAEILAYVVPLSSLKK
jgi:3-hydroxyacyl-[acyl-carrier-protein] dehydratase